MCISHGQVKTRSPEGDYNTATAELSAATVAVRLDKMMKQELELPVDKSFFWTDSTSVFKFIANRYNRFHIFVANRVAQIHDGSTPAQCRHVPTKIHPADDASRGLKVDAFLTDSRWKMGPPFLWEIEEHALPQLSLC